MKKIALFMCAALVGASATYAVPAKRVWRTFTQPDGTKIELMQAGDEFAHYFLTRSGEYVLQAADGAYKYATVDTKGELTTIDANVGVASDLIANIDKSAVEKAIGNRAQAKRALRSASKASARKNAVAQSGMGRFTSNYPRTGDVRCLVFLVEYTDVKFQTENPQEFYDNFCNGDDFKEYGATGSVGKYFRDQSNNLFRPVYDVFGPVPLKNKQSYYGGNKSNGDDKAPEEMVLEAVEYYKNQIDFSKYDFDNDGYVDNIFILYAGKGEASYGSSNTVWPHSYEIHHNYTAPTYNGKIIDSYTCSNEWEQYNPDGIGTFCHEFSHTMGLPDLYHTQSSSATYTPGSWSVLDYGPYNNDGRTPPNYSIYERNAMGWIEPTVLTGPACISLEPITSNTGCLIQTEKTTEFFLLENRQQKGWDTYIPGHGMLIWHVDFNQAKFDDNSVNNSKTHQYVDIVEANNEANSDNEMTMAGYAFPGTAKNTSFTSTTTPALKSWSGRAIDMPITNIAEKSGIITFDVAGGYYVVDTPGGLTATANEDGQLIVSWNTVQGVDNYLLTVAQKHDGDYVPFGKYNLYNVGNVNTYTVDGVAGRTEYFVSISAAKGSFTSDPSEFVSVTTPAVTIDKIAPSITGWEANDLGSFTISWLPIEDAVDYLLTVKAITRGGESSNTYGFGTASQSTFPDDWTCVGSPEYYGSTSSGYYGSAAPAYKFGVKSTAFTTAVYPADITALSFWMRGASTNSNSYLTIKGRAAEGGDWTVIEEKIKTVDYNSAGKVVNVTIPEGIRQINFTYTKGSGNMAIDDITITCAGEEKTIHADYDRKSVGNVTSHQVNLNASRADGALAYEAHIEAVDTQGKASKTSEVVRITPGTTGINAPTFDNASISVGGSTIFYTGAEGALKLYNTAGIAVAATTTVDGTATLSAPAAGLYILATPEGAVKIHITH